MKPRLAQYKNKSIRAKRRKAAQLYMYGDHNGDYSQAEALWVTWMSDSPNANPSRAFNRKRMTAEIGKIENAIALREAKKKDQVVSELEAEDDKLAKSSKEALALVDTMIKDATQDHDLIPALVKAVNALKGLQKMRQDIGARTDKLEGRLVADAKNPKDVESEAFMRRLEDAMKPKERVIDID